MARLVNTLPPVPQETRYVMEFTETELWYVRRALLDSSPIGTRATDALTGAYNAMDDALGCISGCPFRSMGATRITEKGNE